MIISITLNIYIIIITPNLFIWELYGGVKKNNLFTDGFSEVAVKFLGPKITKNANDAHIVLPSSLKNGH